jgi:hypothetical protein
MQNGLASRYILINFNPEDALLVDESYLNIKDICQNA